MIFNKDFLFLINREKNNHFNGKEVAKMILFSILAIITLILLVSAILIVSIGGAAFIIIFADVLVCIAILVWIMWRLIKKKR